VKAKLPAGALELIDRLDRSIAQLEHVAPPGSAARIERLKKAMAAIHAAIDRAE
jgi:hypothetical protein